MSERESLDWPVFASASIADDHARDLGPRRGLLLAIVGASGVGKDTLIEHAARGLRRDARFLFARRVVTRPRTPDSDSGGEQYLPMDPDVFEALRKTGAFALSWDAHGLRYGIPLALRSVIAGGRVVVANLSRTKLIEASRALGPTIAIDVTAPKAVLRERLLARGREDADAIEQRLARQVSLPAGIRRIEFSNDVPLNMAAAKFAKLLLRVVEAEYEASDQHQLGARRLFDAEGEIDHVEAAGVEG